MRLDPDFIPFSESLYLTLVKEKIQDKVIPIKKLLDPVVRTDHIRHISSAILLLKSAITVSVELTIG